MRFSMNAKNVVMSPARRESLVKGGYLQLGRIGMSQSAPLAEGAGAVASFLKVSPTHGAEPMLVEKVIIRVLRS